MNEYYELGNLIREKREERGYDQIEVARLLDTTQQTVSRWELGTSRPRLSMLVQLEFILGATVDELRKAGRYDTASLTPVRNLVLLPLDLLSPEDFQRFVRDLMQVLYPNDKWRVNGVSGDKQGGYDVVSDSATNPKVSVKREKTFGPSKARKAIAETSSDTSLGKRILALSRQATIKARSEVENHYLWELWDLEALCMQIRRLPKNEAVRLVDRFFPRYRSSFLGISDPTSWLTLDEATNRIYQRNDYSENIPMVGRQAEMESLTSSLDKEDVVLVIGRGGIGKTRLIYEYAYAHQGRYVVFYDHSPITSKAFEELPVGNPVVVLEDSVSRGDNILQIIDGVKRQRPEASVVVTIRKEDLDRFRLLTENIQTYDIEVKDLTQMDARDLARNVIGTKIDEAIVEELARIGYDCPLLIMLGGNMVKDNRVDPRHPKSRFELANVILGRYFDARILRTSDAGSELVAFAIAALQPVRLEDPEEFESLSKLSGVSSENLRRIIDNLEYSGLLLRNKDSIRVVPDLLGEAILHRALIGRSGHDMGYARKIASSATGNSMRHALRNVSVVDWQRVHYGEEPTLAVELWKAAAQEVLILPNSARIEMIRSIEIVAAVASRAALDFVDTVINSPAPNEEKDYFILKHEYTSNDVEQALTTMIAHAGENENLERAMKLLWAIGSKDERPQNTTPEHGLRLLEDLGTFKVWRSFWHVKEYVDIVCSLVVAERDEQNKARKVKLLTPALELEFTSTEMVGDNSIQWSTVQVDREKVRDIRKTIIAFLSTLLTGEVKVALEAISLFKNIIGNHYQDNVLEVEVSCAVEILKRCFCSTTLDPSVRLEAYRALTVLNSGVVPDLCKDARRSLVWDYNLLLERQIRPDWMSRDFDDDSQETNNSSLVKDARDTAVEINEYFESSEALLEWMLCRFMVSQQEMEKTLSDWASQFGSFMEQMMLLRPDLAQLIVTRTENEACSVVESSLLFLALVFLRKASPEAAEKTLRQLISTGNTELVANVVTVRTNDLEWSKKWVMELLDWNDEVTSFVIVRRAYEIWYNDTPFFQKVISRILSNDVSDRVVDSLADQLQYGLIRWSELDQSFQEEIVSSLAARAKLSYSVLQLFEDMVSRHALLIAKSVAAHIAQRYRLEHSVYFDISNTDEYESVLLSIVETGTSAPALAKNGLARLFRSFAGEYNTVVQGFILKLLGSHHDDSILFSIALLREAPHRFVIDSPVFVNQLLEYARLISLEVTTSIKQAIFQSAISGMRSGVAGQAFPEDIYIKDSCTRILETVRLNEDTVELYNWLKNRSNSDIERATASPDVRIW